MRNNVEALKEALEKHPELFEKALDCFNYSVCSDDGDVFVHVDGASKLLSLIGQAILLGEVEGEKEASYQSLICEMEYNEEEDWAQSKSLFKSDENIAIVVPT